MRIYFYQCMCGWAWDWMFTCLFVVVFFWHRTTVWSLCTILVSTDNMRENDYRVSVSRTLTGRDVLFIMVTDTGQGPQIQERERGCLLKKKNEIVNTTFTHTSTWCSILWVRILRPGSRCWQWCLKINHLVWREKEMVWRDERKWRLEVTGCYTDVRSTAICL